MSQICYIWGFTDVLWNNAKWEWSECLLVAEIVAGILPGVDATTLVQPWLEEPWSPYRAGEDQEKQNKRKRLIKLICKVKGVEYNEEKMKKDFKVTANDIKLVVKAVSDIDIKLKEENVI